MSGNDASTQSSSSVTVRASGTNDGPLLIFEDLPLIFVLPTHLSVDELEEIEKVLDTNGAVVTYDIAESSVILGAINSAKRAKFELNTRNITADILQLGSGATTKHALDTPETSLGKRKRAETSFGSYGDTDSQYSLARNEKLLKIVRLDWLRESVEQHRALDLQDYLVCLAKLVTPLWVKSEASKPTSLSNHHQQTTNDTPLRTTPNAEAYISHQGRKFNRQQKSQQSSSRPKLVRESTEEHDLGLQVQLPPLPTWVREGRSYACERMTPADSPNSEFLDLLEKIRLSRILIEDQIGVRAYSTSIASLAAYPYKLSDPQEVRRLPGCDQKTETLFREYLTTGDLAASKAIDNDTALRVIKDFYNIWGVGAKTAREWYYERGWRDHDDVIQYGWNDLSRVQQIGLKFFDEFELKIPRLEVEGIASIVDEHAKALTDNRMTCTIVGGYRRGKQESGDVDIILSHPDEHTTYYLIHNLIVALEKSGWITHTLKLSEANSQRDQQTLGLRVDSSKGGFDTLDKALLVWQDPNWPDKERARAEDPQAKNPNVHRRVDIIISPWRTVGCAIAGWSSGTTFQRDLRRFAKHKYGWKFDSSGVRDRKTGRWVDLERWSDIETRAKTPLEAERRVFEGLGLEYREPHERCSR